MARRGRTVNTDNAINTGVSQNIPLFANALRFVSYDEATDELFLTYAETNYNVL